MHRYFGDVVAYDLFNMLGFIMAMISSLFYFKSKRNVMGLHSKRVIFLASRINRYLGKVVEVVLASVESLLMAFMIDRATYTNRPFGELVGTGADYFGLLSTVSFFWIALSLILVVNPLKQMDITTMSLPVYLFFVKLACFFNGCCWGIPWEYGPYNYHYDHPGNQVPVQAIEAFWALAIFIFLLWYRKKAKTGTMFPMYMILYSATRFCSEFFRREENVLWIFKTYHLLCLAGIAIGLVLLFIAVKFGDKISAFFDKPHAKLDLKIAEYENAHKDEWERKAKEKEREKKNKKMYAKSRKL